MVSAKVEMPQSGRMELGDQHANSPQTLAPAALKPRPPTGPTRMQSPRGNVCVGTAAARSRALTELEDVHAQLVVLREKQPRQQDNSVSSKQVTSFAFS